MKWNNSKAKEGRKYFNSRIIKRELLFDSLLILHISVNDYLLHGLNKVGSFVFLRRECDEVFFDAPISIMDVDLTNKIIAVAIELKGPKTENISKLQVNDNILVKGPFWNGVLGRRHIVPLKDSKAVLICRGIGQAPMLPVLKHLCEQNNSVTVLIDKAKYNTCFIEEYLKSYNLNVSFVETLEKGSLKKDFKEYLQNLLTKLKPSVVYCSAADILNYEIMVAIEDVNKNLHEVQHEINYACCNNAKMCCGEGICGGCTLKNNDHKLRHLCKMQTDPKYILKGRRLL